MLENDAVTHGFSTRKGGVSPAPWDSLNLDDRRGDDIANVQENFRRLCAALDCQPADLMEFLPDPPEE